MKKYLFTLLLTIVGAVSTWAQNTLTCVVVEFNSGETISLALSEKPKAQFEQNDLVITSEKFEGRYTVTDVKRFYFDEVPDGIKAVEADNRKSAGIIYDAEGRKVATYNGSIDTTTLPTGAYVVKTESGKAFKVIKK